MRKIKDIRLTELSDKSHYFSIPARICRELHIEKGTQLEVVETRKGYRYKVIGKELNEDVTIITIQQVCKTLYANLPAKLFKTSDANKLSLWRENGHLFVKEDKNNG